MKVGIFIADSNGGYPVPAVKGGAVSTLVEHLVKENNKKQLINMEIVSIYNKEAVEKSKEYVNVSFMWIKPPPIITWMDSIAFIIFRTFFKKKKSVSYKSLFSLVYFIIRAIKLVNKESYDKIVLENNIPLAWIIKKSNYKGDYYYHLHNVPRINAGCKDVFQNATAILCVSKYVADQVKRENNPIGPINPDRTKVLYNCIDTEHFQHIQNQDEINRCRKMYGISDEDKVIIFVGRLSAEKGIDKLLETAIKLHRDNLKILIVGSLIYNENIQDKYQILLHEMAEKLDNNVIFTGYIPQEKLPLYYSIADIAVLPSMWDEPAGLTMMEAMACGLPVITTKSGGIPEYIGRYGIIIERKDVERGIANSIDMLLEEYNLQKEKYIGADYIRKYFSSEKYLYKFIQCIE